MLMKISFIRHAIFSESVVSNEPKIGHAFGFCFSCLPHGRQHSGSNPQSGACYSLFGSHFSCFSVCFSRPVLDNQFQKGIIDYDKCTCSSQYEADYHSRPRSARGSYGLGVLYQGIGDTEELLPDLFCEQVRHGIFTKNSYPGRALIYSCRNAELVLQHKLARRHKNHRSMDS